MTDFIRTIQNPFRFKLFLLSELPLAFIAGLKIKEVNEEKCIVTAPYKYFTKNPFKSIYFACLSMAAEMSTGILSMMHVYHSKPAVSMLVVGLEAEFFKKATGKISFICNDGKKIAETISLSKISLEGKTVTAVSSGYNDLNEKVAEFRITWSFKVKKQV